MPGRVDHMPLVETGKHAKAERRPGKPAPLVASSSVSFGRLLGGESAGHEHVIDVRRPQAGEANQLTSMPAGDTLSVAVSPRFRPVPDQQKTAALLRLAQRGDGEAFGRIYDRYVDQVYRYLYHRVGSHALAEDLTADTFLRALRRIDSFSWQGRDIGAWFITIARNLVNDHVRSSRFRLEIPTGDMRDIDYADEGPEQQVVDRLQFAELVHTVRQLKSDQQECLVLRFLQGLSVTETAVIMDRSEGAVKQLQLRAVRSVARLLTRSGAVTAEDGVRNS